MVDSTHADFLSLEISNTFIKCIYNENQLKNLVFTQSKKKKKKFQPKGNFIHSAMDRLI